MPTYKIYHKPPYLTIEIPDDFKGSIIGFYFDTNNPPTKELQDALIEEFPGKKVSILTDSQINIDDDFVIIPEIILESDNRLLSLDRNNWILGNVPCPFSFPYDRHYIQLPEIKSKEDLEDYVGGMFPEL